MILTNTNGMFSFVLVDLPVFPGNTCNVIQGARLVLCFACHEQGCHSNNEAVVLLTRLDRKESMQVHLRCGNAGHALI